MVTLASPAAVAVTDDPDEPGSITVAGSVATAGSLGVRGSLATVLSLRNVHA